AGGFDTLLDGTAILAGLIALPAEASAGWAVRYQQEIQSVQKRLEALRSLPLVPVPAEASPARMPVGPIVPERGEVAVAPAAELKGPPPTPSEAVVRVTAESLNRLMSLAGESLVQARWLRPFATALLLLKKQQDHLASLIDTLGSTLAPARRGEQGEQL